MRQPLCLNSTTIKNTKNKDSYATAAKKAVATLSNKDLQKQILALQKQVLKLTAMLAKNERKMRKAPPKSKRVPTQPDGSCVAGSHSLIKKWQPCKRFTVSRKGCAPSRALAWAQLEGKFYLKLPKGQVTLLSKVTRLSFRGVHLTSKKSMRLVLSGEKPLVLPERVKGDRESRCKSGKGEKRQKQKSLLRGSPKDADALVTGDSSVLKADVLPEAEAQRFAEANLRAIAYARSMGYETCNPAWDDI